MNVIEFPERPTPSSKGRAGDFELLACIHGAKVDFSEDPDSVIVMGGGRSYEPGVEDSKMYLRGWVANDAIAMHDGHLVSRGDNERVVADDNSSVFHKGSPKIVIVRRLSYAAIFGQPANLSESGDSAIDVFCLNPNYEPDSATGNVNIIRPDDEHLYRSDLAEYIKWLFKDHPILFAGYNELAGLPRGGLPSNSHHLPSFIECLEARVDNYSDDLTIA